MLHNFTSSRLHGFVVSLLALLAMTGFTACSETDAEEDTEYLNWQERNTTYFKNVLRTAAASVAEAKATYGDDWESHCDWRVYRNYSISESVSATYADSIAVRVLHQGTGSGCPYYTDSVRVNFLGRLIPNELSTDQTSRTTGKVFTYTGSSADSVNVFSPEYCTPSTRLVSNNIEGFTTALLYMHIGDMWRVYIPQELGYASTATTNIPAYSTLIFDIELKAYYRKGVSPGDWN